MSVRNKIAAELHKPARRKYTRRSVTLKGLNDLYQADLVEMLPYAKENGGMRYILTMINCLSKFAIAIPLKSKTATEVLVKLEPILKKHKMKHLQTDDGKEWFNSKFAGLMARYKINHYSTYSETKASIVERLNRTLKEKMWREFTARGSYRWLNILPSIVRSYNNTRHKTIGMKPTDVRRKHVKAILAVMNRKQSVQGKKLKTPKFSLDDLVRISKNKRVFTKGYLPNWTNEVFKIYAVRPTRPVTYILQDSKGETIKGGFYEEELSKATTGDVYLVEKILKRRGNKMLVRWHNFDSSHDTWITDKDLM